MTPRRNTARRVVPRASRRGRLRRRTVGIGVERSASASNGRWSASNGRRRRRTVGTRRRSRRRDADGSCPHSPLVGQLHPRSLLAARREDGHHRRDPTRAPRRVAPLRGATPGRGGGAPRAARENGAGATARFDWPASCTLDTTTAAPMMPAPASASATSGGAASGGGDADADASADGAADDDARVRGGGGPHGSRDPSLEGAILVTDQVGQASTLSRTLRTRESRSDVDIARFQSP